MTVKKSHSVGERPTNPIVTARWAYYIENIQEEPAPEDMDDGLTHWSYDVVKQVPIEEYLNGIQRDIALSAARVETNAYETTLYLLSAMTGGDA